jgi:hypothetical protein
MFFLAREEDSTMDLTLTLTRDTHHCHTELIYLIVSLFSIATQFNVMFSQIVKIIVRYTVILSFT